MITSKSASEIILNHTKNIGVEEIDFLKTNGRILKEEIKADRDFPPFNRVSMDGIAINFDVFNSGKKIFIIEGIQAAGSEQQEVKNKENCMEVMTGSVLPKNVDTVIPYELVNINNGVAVIQTDKITFNQNVHNKGRDRKTNEILIKSNTIISPAEIGVFATVGKSKVRVAKNPKVIIISTGDELVEVSENPLSHQIRRSNAYTLVSLLEKLHIQTETVHIKDDKPKLRQKIKGFLKNYDVLLFSGAVSKGKYDFVPEILDELDVEKLFHRVKQRPGKPFWFGQLQNKLNNPVVFAFPGNPVSTYVGCLKYFYPWFQKSINLDFENKQFAILAEDYFFKPELTYFLQVRIRNKNGSLYAKPITGNGSGDLANLIDADAFLELPDNRNEFKKGEIFPLIKYRN